MANVDIYQRVVDHWRAQGVPVLPPASAAEIGETWSLVPTLRVGMPAQTLRVFFDNPATIAASRGA